MKHKATSTAPVPVQVHLQRRAAAAAAGTDRACRERENTHAIGVQHYYHYAAVDFRSSLSISQPSGRLPTHPLVRLEDSSRDPCIRPARSTVHGDDDYDLSCPDAPMHRAHVLPRGQPAGRPAAQLHHPLAGSSRHTPSSRHAPVMHLRLFNNPLQQITQT